jgi:hypothetical protein
MSASEAKSAVVLELAEEFLDCYRRSDDSHFEWSALQ